MDIAKQGTSPSPAISPGTHLPGAADSASAIGYNPWFPKSQTRTFAERGDQQTSIGNMQWLIQYIEANLSSQLPVSDLARQSGLNQHHFCRFFKRTTGVTPHQYVLAKRLSSAAKMIVSTRLPLGDIASAVGFADLSAFGKAFRKRFGKSPSTFRDSHTETAGGEP